ncbi:MAG: type II secretion system protein N [Granulosicoccus sp.]|nr:type II secretion system protein N [Granulosicoccus sp.]
MRIVWLCLLGAISYLVSMLVLFPAAPVVDRIRPHLGLVALDGVSGKLYSGVVSSVRSTDDLLPLELQNVAWTVSPGSLLQGGAGARISFDGYGGGGSGLVSRQWNGEVVVSDFKFTAEAKALEPLLPVPIASFAGELSGTIDQIVLANNLLQRLGGQLTWSNAALERPVPTALGTVQVLIEPEADLSHVVNLSAEGGDVTMNGTVTVRQNGDFAADVLLSPAPGASPEVVNGLRQMGRPDAQGRVRLQRQGNVNRLM